MSCDSTRKQTAVQHSLDDPSHKRSAVELRHFLRDGDVGVDHRVVVDQHVLVFVVSGFLEPVGRLVEDGAVEGCCDELKDP